ncbi:MAG: putative DNA binding domain-containing protein [Erysipelotrichaceae bacterium]|nr:putative DNA binding domain-containing protein [Erysipelotrichaceae bacterium]
MIIGKESETLEFKLSTGEMKEAAESIAAILNKHSKGTLYFGVDDSGFVKGQMISDSTRKDISRIISETIEPKINPNIEVLTVGGKDIIRVEFSGHNRPYSVNGRYLMRMGSENRRMNNDDLKRLIKHDDYSSKWEEELSGYTINDIDEESLLDFYHSAKDSGRLDLKRYDVERLLTGLDLIEENRLKNAANALFGKNTRISLKLATYATDNKVTFTDLKLVNGNIYNLVNEALNYVLEKINWSAEIGTGRKRKDVPEIPEKALREIIVNAFAHCDYESVPEIEIGIHPNTIEIYNPGSFPDDLTPYDFIERNLPSYKRNRLILDVLFRSKDVEKAGTGFQRVDEICKEKNIHWTYRKEAHGFFFVFLRGNKSEVPVLFLNKAEKTVYDLIEKNTGITKLELSLRIGKSEKTVQRIISSLTDKNLIERIGSNKSGFWKIVSREYL